MRRRKISIHGSVMAVSGKRPALLVIDMINDFAGGDEAYSQRFAQVAEEIGGMAAFFREKGWPVIFISDAHDVDDREFGKWGAHALHGSTGCNVVDGLAPESQDIVLEKKTYNAFFKTDLEQRLKSLCAGPLVVTGVLTDICIHYSAVHAFYLGYEVYLPKECMTAFTPELHELALKAMEKSCATVVPKQELLEKLSARLV